MAISNDSRLTLTYTVLPVDIASRAPTGKAFVDLRQRVPKNDTTDAFITVGIAPWPLIGRELLGAPGRWWAIADTTSVVDPFSELAAGVTLRVPTLERLLFDVLRA